MKFNIEIQGYFELSEKELKGQTQEDIQKFIKEVEISTKKQLLSEVEDKEKANFQVKITID